MEDEYAIAHLRQFIAGRNFFPPTPTPTDMGGGGTSAHTAYPYDMLVFRSDSAPGIANANASAAAAASSSGGAVVGGGGMSLSGGGGDGVGTGRWPRQETLTLLEIRSRLDAKFKEANQKGPLWEEVSRIMSDEHGYQRSGRKCREKFENLYKYYKKTKEGKAGRQDGKHYRFFRQLEALYGGEQHHHHNSSESQQLLRGGGGGSFHYTFHNQEPSFLAPKLPEPSLSFSNYSDPDITSSDDTDRIVENEEENDPHSKKRRGKEKKKKNKSSWKVKIRDFIDEHMKKLMEKQEVWMDKMMMSMEDKERERMRREEEWRKQDADRILREHEFWSRERAWIESRDAALMDALHKLSGKETENGNGNDEAANTTTIWPECEINKLIQLRTSMDVKFQQRGGGGGISEEMLWEEIATKMAFFGHERSSLKCKEKWDSVSNFVLKGSKRRGENSKGYYDPVTASPQVYSEQGVDDNTIISLSGGDHQQHGNSNASALSENCFRYFMGDAYGRIVD